jgi:hypothetical protein
LLRFSDNVQANVYWARTSAEIPGSDNMSYRARFAYTGDRYGFEADRVVVGPAFNPEVGFVRRSDAAMNFASARFSPRLRGSRLVRKLTWEAELDYVTDAAGDTLEDRALAGRFGIEFNSSDDVQVTMTRQYERLPADFTIARGVVVPAGPYNYQFLSVNYSLAQQRMVSGSASASHGSFYDGTRTTASYSGRIGVSAHLALEPNLTFNWVRLPAGDFTARLIGVRFVVAPTARLGFSSLTQFNPSAETVTSSVRMRWEYAPGSDLYVVYSDGRDTAARGLSTLLNRSFAVKATRLLRF